MNMETPPEESESKVEIIELEPELEKQIQDKALPYLEGRGRWDRPHTEVAVDWMKQLIQEEGGNERILVTAAWFHDNCYNLSDIDDFGYDGVLKVKEQHSQLGADKAREILSEIGGFTDEEIVEIARLILNHDELDKMAKEANDNDIRLLEADSLGMIDDRVNPEHSNFSKDDVQRFLDDEFVPQRLTLFRSEFATKNAEGLLEKLKKAYEIE